MHAFVTNELLQSARRSAKRKRAARACLSCKEKRAKCSGYSPCPRCVNAADCIFQTNTEPHHLDCTSPRGLEDASASNDKNLKTATLDRQPPLYEMGQPRSYQLISTGRRSSEDLGDQSVVRRRVSLREVVSNQTHEIFSQPVQISFQSVAVSPSTRATNVIDSVFSLDKTNPVAIEISLNAQPLFTNHVSDSDQSRLLQARMTTHSSVGMHPIRPMCLAYDAPSQLSLLQPPIQLGYAGSIVQALPCKVPAHASDNHSETQAGYFAHSADVRVVAALPIGGQSLSSAVGALKGPGAREVLRATDGNVDDRDLVISGGWTCPPRAWLDSSSSLGGGGATAPPSLKTPDDARGARRR